VAEVVAAWGWYIFCLIILLFEFLIVLQLSVVKALTLLSIVMSQFDVYYTYFVHSDPLPVSGHESIFN